MNRPALVTSIAALSTNHVIGRDNDLPWKLPRDLKFFKQTTLNHAVIVGRKSFESTGALPKRTHFVLTRQPDYAVPDGVYLCASLEEALERTADQERVFLLGGEAVFTHGVEWAATDMLLTRVHALVEGDTYFPRWNEADWERVWHEDHPADERNAYDMTFERWVRRRS